MKAILTVVMAALLGSSVAEAYKDRAHVSLRVPSDVTMEIMILTPALELGHLEKWISDVVKAGKADIETLKVPKPLIVTLPLAGVRFNDFGVSSAASYKIESLSKIVELLEQDLRIIAEARAARKGSFTFIPTRVTDLGQRAVYDIDVVNAREATGLNVIEKLNLVSSPEVRDWLPMNNREMLAELKSQMRVSASFYPKNGNAISDVFWLSENIELPVYGQMARLRSVRTQGGAFLRGHGKSFHLEYSRSDIVLTKDKAKTVLCKASM